MSMNYDEAKVLMTDLRTLMNLLGVEYDWHPVEKPLNDDENEKSELPKQLWVHVTWRPSTDSDWDKLFKFEQIIPYYFDKGAGFGGRDWELDWSFKVKEGVDRSYTAIWNKLQKIIHPITNESFINALNKFTINGLLNVVHPGIYGHDEFIINTPNNNILYAPEEAMKEIVVPLVDSIQTKIKDFVFGDRKASADYYYHDNKLHVLLDTGSNGPEASCISSLEAVLTLLKMFKENSNIKYADIADTYFDNCDDVYTFYIVLSL